MEQPAQHGFRRQVEQLFHFQGAGQRFQVLPLVPVGVAARHLVGQTLQHQAGGAAVAGGQPQAGGQLLGLLEVALQALRQGVAFQGHDALVLAALVRGDGDHHGAVADQRADIGGGVQLAVVAGQGAQLAVVGALRQQQ